MGAALLTTACNRQPEALADCRDAACKQTWVMDHWKADPHAVAVAIGQLSEPVEKVALVQALAEAFPGETAQLCGLLPDGDALERCTRLNQRPHLWQVTETGPASDETAEDQHVSGPMALEWLEPASPVRDPWEGLSPILGACDGERSVCQAAAARTAAIAGDAQTAAQACLGVEDPKWRQECMFQASDAAYEGEAPHPTTTALSLCMGTAEYFTRCLTHLVWHVAGKAPIAGSAKAEDWTPIREAGADVRAMLASTNPVLTGRLEQMIWSDTLRCAYEETSRVNGAPLASVPETSVLAARSSAARRLLVLEFGQSRSLEGWGERLQEVLSDREPAPTKRTRPCHIGAVNSGSWTSELPGEEDITWIMFEGTNRRTTSPDPKVDNRIAMLEAAALIRPARTSMLVEGLRDEDPLVRWTAARLLSYTEPSNPYLQDMRTDPDTRVRLRANRSGEVPP